MGLTDKNFIAIDLEHNQPSGSIIEVGLVVGNLASGQILDRYQQYIWQDEKVSPFITQLTTITQEQVDNGIPLAESYEHIKEIHARWGCFRNPICWSGGDSAELARQLAIDDSDNFVFGRRWLDAKTLYISWCFAQDKSHRSGLSKSMGRIGLQFKGKKHTALADAENTFHIYRKLVGLYQTTMQKAWDEHNYYSAKLGSVTEDELFEGEDKEQLKAWFDAGFAACLEHLARKE